MLTTIAHTENYLYICTRITFSPTAPRSSRINMNAKTIETILRIVAMLASAIAGYLSHDPISTLF